MNHLDLVNCIKTGAIFLFLGQNYLREYLGEDMFLKAIKQKYSIDEESFKYPLLKSLNSIIDIESALMWMKEKSDRIASPDDLEEIAKLPWSGVITTAFDTILPRAFETTNRSVNEITKYISQSQNVFISKSKLNISMLFGNITQDTRGDHPPFDEFEMMYAQSNATKMIERYSPDTITPYGKILIDSYDYETDWFDPHIFYTTFSKFSTGQIHYFGVKKAITNKFINKLVEDGIVILHQKTLAEFLNDLIRAELIDISKIQSESYGNQKRVMINRTSVIIPENLNSSISSEMMIMDDTILLPPPTLTKSETYEEYRSFLYYSGTKPQWLGYKLDFSIQRSFESELCKAIDEELKKEYNLNIVVLHGQTGSSKSIVLGKVAYKHKTNRKYPILFIYNDTNFNKIHDFCKWCEDSGAEKTLLFCDTSSSKNDINKMLELNNFLVSKGRKVLIVGTTYKQSDITNKQSNVIFVEAPVELNEIEKKDLINSFEKYSDISISNELLDGNILSAMYRLLPATRRNLRTGVIAEANRSEITMGELLKVNNNEQSSSLTAIQYAMLKAGISIDIDVQNDISDNDEFKSILNMLCFVGQFDLKIPVELVFRSLDISYNSNIVKGIYEIDFFTLEQNNFGLWDIGIRNKLEAEIVIKSHLSQIEEQIELLYKLIENIKDTSFYESRSELNFMIELLKRVGPNSGNNRYSLYYEGISKKLKHIRENSGISNSRTILQESTFLRESMKNNNSTENAFEDLEHIKYLLSGEIELMISQKASASIIGYLIIELSSVLGSQIKLLKDSVNSLKLLDELFDLVHRVQKYLPSTLYGIDILSWSCEEMSNRSIDEMEKISIYSKAMFACDQIEFLGDDILTDSLDALKLKISQHLNIEEDMEIYYEKLIKNQNSNAVYLKAKHMLNDVKLNNELSISQLEKCKETYEYLYSCNDLSRKDEKCLYLMLKLFWIINSKKPLFYTDKIKLPFSNGAWQEILDLIQKIIEISDNEPNAYIYYLQAIAHFHLENISDCEAVFKKIRDDYYIGSKRIILSYLASSENGEARKYRGKLAALKENKAIIYVDSIRKHVSYHNKGFINRNHELYTTYTDFNIGFNFLGFQITNLLDEGGYN